MRAHHLAIVVGLVAATSACEKKATEKSEATIEPAAATPNMIGPAGKKPSTSTGSTGTNPTSTPGESTGPTKKPGSGGSEVSPVQRPH